jgi:hypothetical protein
MLPKSIKIETAAGFEEHAKMPSSGLPPFPQLAADPGSFDGFGEVDGHFNQSRKFFRGKVK